MEVGYWRSLGNLHGYEHTLTFSGMGYAQVCRRRCLTADGLRDVRWPDQDCWQMKQGFTAEYSQRRRKTFSVDGVERFRGLAMECDDIPRSYWRSRALPRAFNHFNWQIQLEHLRAAVAQWRPIRAPGFLSSSFLGKT